MAPKARNAIKNSIRPEDLCCWLLVDTFHPYLCSYYLVSPNVYWLPVLERFYSLANMKYIQSWLHLGFQPLLKQKLDQLAGLLAADLGVGDLVALRADVLVEGNHCVVLHEPD